MLDRTAPLSPSPSRYVWFYSSFGLVRDWTAARRYHRNRVLLRLRQRSSESAYNGKRAVFFYFAQPLSQPSLARLHHTIYKQIVRDYQQLPGVAITMQGAPLGAVWFIDALLCNSNRDPWPYN